MEMNRKIPRNYFNEVEPQAAFSAVKTSSPNGLLAGQDAGRPASQLSRCPPLSSRRNFETLTVNRPQCPVHSLYAMASCAPTITAATVPTTSQTSLAVHTRSALPRVALKAYSGASRSHIDQPRGQQMAHQAGDLFRLMSPADASQSLISNLAVT